MGQLEGGISKLYMTCTIKANHGKLFTKLLQSPGFIFHWWDGPDSNVVPQFDLPARAYSSYLAFDHVTDPRRSTGLENNLTIGYYSDFNNTSTDAIRLTAKLLGWYRLNEYTVGKLGVEYLDRVDVKMLPAVGFYMFAKLAVEALQKKRASN